MMFKTPEEKKRFFYLHPLVRMIAAEVEHHCLVNKMPFIITSTVSTIDEDRRLMRESTTHLEGRAFDLSTLGMTKRFVDSLVKIFNTKYESIAAIGKDGEPKLAYFHNNGNGDHIHFQIKKDYALKPRTNF